ncbi:DUF998 domain-containing protein [Nonomuraea soli]|uniref:Pimeloyl-ACP methyl ester carboxylesterase n=1 Tax=Nonomuraea soli TaxID=1032476 RepID=A0A7W0HN63_9ACTN|nr:DUF998 domain-containing protein [Nonomuraea soli]MBA2889447.1 pimeloyl-ACP methyl ester carboxylesterase [Nonomuraea soli]
MERRLIIGAAWAFVIAAIFYSAWVTGQFVDPAVDRSSGYVSELAARDQSWSAMFRLTTAVAGLATLAGVALVPRVAHEWAGWLALGLFGLFTFGEALFPLDCAALSDPACERGGRSFSHHAHYVTAALAIASVTVSMLLLSRTRLAWAVTGAALLATVAELAAIAAGTLAGLAQRTQLALIAVWLLYIALRLVTHRPVIDPGVQHVVRAGEGPAVLITSGPSGAWYHWDRVADELAVRHRVIRFDRPGLGLSACEELPPTLYGEAARLAALSPAHPELVTVVAHATSAWHAEAFARLHPLRIRSLVLVDPVVQRARKRGTSQLGRTVGRWLPALGGTWGAHAAAVTAGPALHRAVTGASDRSGLYRSGRVLAATLGEWLAGRDMCAELWKVREEHDFPAIPVVIINAGRPDAGQEVLARSLGARIVRAEERVQWRQPDVVVRACAPQAQ